MVASPLVPAHDARSPRPGGGEDRWRAPQLAEFLAAVSSCGDEASVVAAAVEQAARAVAAPIGALVGPGRTVTAGLTDGAVSEGDLRAAAAGGEDRIDVRGAGSCAVVSTPLDESPPVFLLVARPGEAFSDEEAALLRIMARVLSLALRMLRTLEAHRTSREESDRQAEENARLLASLQERQLLLESLFRIQRSISHREPVQSVLDAITEGAAQLLGDEVVGLRLVDGDDPTTLVLVSSVGVPAEVAEAISRSDGGIGTLAIAARRLIVTHDYANVSDPLAPFVERGLRAAMAAPVFQDGEPIGSLVVASYAVERRYGAMEQELLLAFAEHASLALNDASALDAMRRSYADAVHRASHDALTGLPNRLLVVERLDAALSTADRRTARVGVLFVDLDRFKVVNDTLGHSIGDEVLICVAERLRQAVRPGDVVGRLAGDEFVVVCDDVDERALLSVAERVADAVAAPMSLYGRDAVITASIGVAHVHRGGRAEDVLRDADVAMYRAKERGRARTEVFDHRIRARLLERLETEQALRWALNNGELRLHYQPIVRAGTRELLAFEALVRWEHPLRGLVQPSQFVPVAEETGLIVPIGRWVLREACHQLGEWRAAGCDEGLRVNVNLSARQFTDPGIVGIVAQALGAAGLPPDAVSLEITESVLMDAESTSRTLAALKELGVRLSIDDFGTGYSSLSYLKRFPVDTLKIDRSFVDGLGVDPEDDAIVNAVVSLAHALGLGVVAEGVETDAQLEQLFLLGCDAAQGYLFGRPAAGDAWALPVAGALAAPAFPFATHDRG